MPILAALGALLSRLVFTKAGAWALGIMAWLGLGLTAHTVVTAPLRGYIEQGFSGLPADVAAWIGFLKIDIYATAVLSAYIGASITRVALRKISA